MKKYLSFVFVVIISLLFISCSSSSTITLGSQVKNFTSYEELNDYVSDKKDNLTSYNNVFERETDDFAMPESGQDNTANDSQKNYSETNIQVEGVNESDTIITDGYYIYIAKGNQFKIIDVSDLTIVYQETFENDYINGMYIYQSKIVLLKNTYYPVTETEPDSNEPEADYWYWRYVNNFTVLIYDKSDINNINLERELEFENANLVDSRMIDDNLFLVLNENVFYYEDDSYIPRYKDSNVADDFIDLAYENIFYFLDNNVLSSYLILSSFSVLSDTEIDINAYMGNSFEVYMSENNLYISAHKYIYPETDLERFNVEYKTTIMRFEIIEDNLIFKAATDIEGFTLNQFSFDEYEGVLRVATTDYDYTETEVNITNQLYLLDATDEELTEISILENLGKPNERIYAVRFSGEIGYVVTFVNTDPLYKLDLSNPQEPEILGELYEEGVSDYLHMITEDLMLGVGRNAETVDGVTRFTGVKIALYDVSQDTPITLETILVEGEYSYTNVIYNHKLFVTYEVEGEDYVYVAIPISGYSESYSNYYQGIYVYKVNYEGSLEFVVELSHLSEEYDYFDTIERAVFIDEFIYTISYSRIIQYDIEDKFNIVDELILNESFYDEE
ncbi:MAG: beta-propeller domain-containing protein [Bacillota bacterium]